MNKIVITLFSISIILFFASTSHANEVLITSPDDGERVGAKVIVKGKSTINDGSHIWVLTHPKSLPDQWWPQLRPVVDENGTWQSLAYIGQSQDIGIEFEIAVASFDIKAESAILQYHEIGKKTGQWLPISFPKATSSIDLVTVRKTTH